MTIETMFNSMDLSLAEIRSFLSSANKIAFRSKSVNERNGWIQKVIMRHKYFQCLKPEKTLIRTYIRKMTGLSKSQTTRIIKDYKKRGTLEPKEYKRNKFPKIYGLEAIALLAEIDNAHNRLSGPATKKIIQEEFTIFNHEKYEKLAGLSVSHLYRLRGTRRYHEKAKIFFKTRPVKIPIGERAAPEPNGQPGYLSVDTVHQGDKIGEKGIYHINIVDMATQFEFVGAVAAISEKFMAGILQDLLKKFPFKIVEFHTDNGSEYINKIVAGLLNKLLIRLTKSRPRHTNDNPLVETKNGAVIRKHMGYVHIPRRQAPTVNVFYQDWFNDYLNYHRPCAFAKIAINEKGKEVKTYPHENYMTPYEKLKSIKDIKKYMKPDVAFKELNKTAYAMGHTAYAIQMQKEKIKMLKAVFNKTFLPILSTEDN